MEFLTELYLSIGSALYYAIPTPNDRLTGDGCPKLLLPASFETFNLGYVFLNWLKIILTTVRLLRGQCRHTVFVTGDDATGGADLLLDHSRGFDRPLSLSPRD